MTRDNLSLVGGGGGRYSPPRFSDKNHFIYKPRQRGFFSITDPAMRSLSKTTELRLINLRWLSMLAMLVVALLSKNLIGTYDLIPRLLGIAAIVGAMNGVLLVCATRSRGGVERLPVFSAFVQLCIDLLAWGSFIYLSGGATNPLISIFLPLVAIGAMVLDRLHAWLLGIIAILAYSYLWRFYQPLAIADVQMATGLHIFGMWLVFVVSDIVVVWFILQMTKAVRERDAALAEAREQAIRNDWLVSMGSLAAGAAHELSTPLGTLNLLVDGLAEEVSIPDAWRADLDLMRRQIDVCKAALTQLARRAEYPRADAGDVVPATRWLRRVIDAWVVLNPSTPVTLFIAPDLNTAGLGVDLSIERALCNLLDNARQAGATTINVDGSRSIDDCHVVIVDNGPGIPRAVIEDLVAGRPTHSARGMGVGLLLARAAIERRGGTLQLGLGAAGGSRVRISLPIGKMPNTGESD